MKKMHNSQVSVTREDQANINTFSKLYSKSQDNKGLLAAINEKIQQHKDTLDEFELNDEEDKVRYRFGMCFFTLSTGKARTLVEQDIQRLESQKNALDKEMETCNKKIKKLKSTLYGKFGNSINLEE